MTKDDVRILAEALQHRDCIEESRKRIHKVLGNKSCATILKECKALIAEMEKKDKNKVLLLVVLAILLKKHSVLSELQKVLVKEGFIPNLYGALIILLNGKSPSFHLEIKIADENYPNRYGYLCRFDRFFSDNIIREVIYAVKILAMSDRSKFEDLAWKDHTYLILLNMISYQLDETPSDELITRLLADTDEMRANIGFHFAVRSITGDVRDYNFLRRNPEIPYPRTKHEVDENITKHLEHFDHMFCGCSPKRKASLLVNYILYEKEYPIQFGYWIMEIELQEALIYEITSSNKISSLKDLYKITSLIHDFPCRSNNGARGRKDKLYRAVLIVLKKFVKEKGGIYTWDSYMEELFQGICKKMPGRYLKQLYHFLENISEDLMVYRLDEMVRFSIYLEDKRCWDICQGMMNVIRHHSEARAKNNE